MDIRDSVHRSDIPDVVFVERLIYFISERNAEYGENTSPSTVSMVRPRNSATSYNDPVVKTRITPILRRMGSCSCMTAMIGRISITRSTTTPKIVVGIIESADLRIFLEWRCSANVSPDRGVAMTNEKTATPV